MSRYSTDFGDMDLEDFFDEDAAIMNCGHLGRYWSSEWKQCLKCVEGDAERLAQSDAEYARRILGRAQKEARKRDA